MWVELCSMSFKGSLPLLKPKNFQKSSILSAILLYLLSLTNSSVTSESKHFHPMQSRRECHCFLRAPTSDSYPAEVLAVKRWEETKKRRLTTVGGCATPNIYYVRPWTGPGSKRRLGTRLLQWGAPWWVELTQIDKTRFDSKPDKAKGWQVHSPTKSILATCLASCNNQCNPHSSLLK